MVSQSTLERPENETHIEVALRLPQELVASLTMVAARLNTDLSTAAEHVLRSHFSARDRVTQTPRQLMAIQAEARARNHIWTEAELTERGLPLYWSEDWLQGQLARGLTFPQLSAIFGYKARTLSQYAHHYGIVQRVNAEKTIYSRARARFENGESRAEIGAALGYSEVTIAKLLKGSQTEKQRYLDQKLTAAGPFPASTSEIASRIFEGNSDLARPWLYRMVKAGRLSRTARDTYTTPAAQDPGVRLSAADD